MKRRRVRGLLGLVVGVLPLGCISSTPGLTRASSGNPIVTIGAGQAEVGGGGYWATWYVIDTVTRTCWLKLGDSAGQMSCCDMMRSPEARRVITWAGELSCGGGGGGARTEVGPTNAVPPVGPAAPTATPPVSVPAPAPTVSSGAPEDAATRGAQVWLALVDQGKYGESWDAAARAFQSAVSRDRWKDKLGAARGPLGRLISRSLKSTEVRTSVPGAPEGKYVILQFTASFENKPAATETVTPMLEPDGSWKVSGYFVR